MAHFNLNVACGIILYTPAHKLTKNEVAQKLTSKDRTFLNHKLE
jgi:hypothetical protein